MRKWMVEFLRKFKNRGIKISWVSHNSHHQIYQLTLNLYSVGVGCDTDIFKLTARALSIIREIYDETYFILYFWNQ